MSTATRMPTLRAVPQTSDLSGQPRTETITFSWQEDTMAIDLTTEEAASLRAALAPFVQAARVRPNPTPPRQEFDEQLSRGAYLVRLRRFAQDAGLEVADPRRPPQWLEEAYYDMHSTSARQAR